MEQGMAKWWRELLKKYMAGVIDAETISFIDHDGSLDAIEIETLETIENELRAKEE